MQKINPKIKKYLITLIAIVLVVFIGSKIIASRNNKPSSKSQTVSAPQKTVTLNKEFTFPVTNVAGTPITMKFTVQDASLNNEIVVQGKNATAVAGRTFLIVTLKLNNTFNQSIQINTRDYVRLSVNGDESTWLAPEIHNDPVEVQAISTKFTRVGFAINTTDKKLVLQIGEIKGNKQKIDLSF